MLLSKVPADEHAPAFLGLGVVGDQANTPLTLITKVLELRHEIADAHSKGLGRDNDGNATVLTPLNEARLLEIRQQHFANPRRHSSRGRGQSGAPCAERRP